jgi:hypothetical protein
VFWVVTTYGLYIGLGALTFNYTFPILILQPPYLWKPTNSGLIAVSTWVGFLLAIPPVILSDRFAARLTRRNNGIREAEMRLHVLWPVCLLPPAGLVLYGMTAEKRLHWIGYFVGVAMDQFGSFFYFTLTLAYAVDSHTANLSEMLIAMNLGKQAISFGMGIYLLEWIQTHGYAVVIAGIFGGILLANNLALIPFIIWGKKIRRTMANSWIARLHHKTAVPEETM